jgi:hypothetical protein
MDFYLVLQGKFVRDPFYPTAVIWSTSKSSVFFIGKISLDGKKKIQKCYFGKKVQKLIFFLITNFFIQFDHFHPFEQIFIKLWWFHPKSGRKCCTFYFIAATRSIIENLQKKHCLSLSILYWGGRVEERIRLVGWGEERTVGVVQR